LRRQFVGSRIKAAVLAHPEVILSSLEVTCEGEAVRLAGVVRSRAALRKIEQEVRAIAGTVALRFELGCPTLKPRPVVSRS
jgi:osmotically-inducible protein OsmY